MAFKFFNIGKANEEITRLEQLVATHVATIAAKPAGLEAGQLAEALASNETISTQLVQAQADLATAKQTIGTITTAKDAAVNELAAVGTALKASATALSLTPREGASHCEMITALQGAVTSTLSKLQVNPGSVPAGKPTNAAGAATEKQSLDAEIKARKAATATK